MTEDKKPLLLELTDDAERAVRMYANKRNMTLEEAVSSLVMTAVSRLASLAKYAIKTPKQKGTRRAKAPSVSSPAEAEVLSSLTLGAAFETTESDKVFDA